VNVDGILNILKPPGKTSFQIVSQVRRLSGERRVGHAGTLDPEASGVLVVCLGQGTRIIEFLSQATKSYYAEIELGVTTDTYDAAGKITGTGDPSVITKDRINNALESFRGVIDQVPPMYSAAKHKGKRLYQLARAGIEVDRKTKKIKIFRLELLDWQSPLVTIEIDCSAGTYIRSLANDLGALLGCGAHLKRLVRIKSEPFHIDDSIPVPLLEEAFCQGDWHYLLYPIDEVVLGWRTVIFGEDSEDMVRKGCSIALEEYEHPEPGDRCRAYSVDGQFLAVLRFREEENLWHPDKVFIK
jgi:tRNA pseudouridine55 synthase